jgi:UDP-GlcNAc:undecaprenyl-phosphate GlcNAc-1-phosphate transferase
MPIVLMLFRVLAIKIGLVDVPNARKIHSNPVPLVGGVSLFVMAVALMFMTKNVSVFAFYLMVSAGLVAFIGLLDDLYQLSAFLRFAVQIIGSLIVIYFADVRLETFGYLLWGTWDLNLGYLAVPITVFGVVGVINALNMADGIDGLAAMTFFSPVLVMAYLSGFNAFSLWLVLLLLCVLIFVLFNKSKRFKVFLGDNGSLFLGFILAWLLVYFSQGTSAVMKPVTALYLVAVPVYDTIFVMLRRILKGLSPFEPDKTHLHHLFLSFGLTQTQALFAMLASQFSLIALGLIFLKFAVAAHLQFYLFVLLSAVYYFFMQKIWSRFNQS